MNSRKKLKILDPDDQMQRLGERIKSLRKSKGYTSAETFANEKGFNRALYGKYESGKRNIEFITLVRLANAFEINLQEFFGKGFND